MKLQPSWNPTEANPDLMTLDQIVDYLNIHTATLRFSDPVTHVYNPLEYAREGYVKYVTRYGTEPKSVVLAGMNPGPWGMVQTGIPFGDVTSVRDWLGISAQIGRPHHLHPKRPVYGFSCPRSEISGRRVWGWAESRFGTPESFFEFFFVANYCPLAFFNESGRNITPDRLRKKDRIALFDICDHAMVQTVRSLNAKHVIACGTFVFERLRKILQNDFVEISRVTHPSPANPRANKGWSDIMNVHIMQHRIVPEKDLLS